MYRTIVVLAFASSSLGAQSLADVPTVLDGALGQGSGITTASGMASRAIRVGPGDRISLGLGARVTALVTSGIRLGPADPVGFAAPADSLVVSGAGVAFNIGINAGFAITDRWQVGMNLDVFGFGGGASNTGSYRRAPGAVPEPMSNRPASPNMFTGGDSDRGMLNSEFFLTRTINDRYALRGGLSHQLVEFAVNVEDVESGASRFRRFANLAFIGLRITTGQ